MFYKIKTAGRIEAGREYTIGGVFVPRGSTVHSNHGMTLVLKRAGYGENPGSRYSGLYSYYPAEFEVYEVQTQRTDENGDTVIIAKRVAEFPVRSTKPKGV